MITLFSSGFSPYSRKVRMVLEFKNLPYEIIEIDNAESDPEFTRLSRRREVPAIRDGDLFVINSSDIAAYLDHRYPARPVYPDDPRGRVAARDWERLSDTLVDAIVSDVGTWAWAEIDPMPEGLKEDARRDLNQIYDEMNAVLVSENYLVGEFSIAEMSLFPHIWQGRRIGLSFSDTAHPGVAAWYQRLKTHPITKGNSEATLKWFETFAERDIVRDKIPWRTDRLEWLLAKGYHDWFYGQIAKGKTIWPV